MGIKSFQGATATPQKNEASQLKVTDFMSRNLITFKPEDSILQVMETLINHKISGGPVVDENGDLVGMISEGDCMKQISESRYYNMPMGDQKVSQYMVTKVDTLPSETSIFDAAAIFFKTKRKRFPVMEDGKMIGQISRRDVLKAALNMKSSTWK
ncbi:MAG: CBS domain-containing protein [Flavobacteriaceae bacterium]|nr:CBS domain-containing protein [Flavobacteriaceae bacterium]